MSVLINAQSISVADRSVSVGQNCIDTPKLWIVDISEAPKCWYIDIAINDDGSTLTNHPLLTTKMKMFESTKKCVKENKTK